MHSFPPRSFRQIFAGDARELALDAGLVLGTALFRTLLFGKPDARPHRRMGVALATGTSLEEARNRADAAAAAIRVLPGG